MTPQDSNDALDELNQILSIVVSGLKPKDIVEATEKYIKYRIKQLQEAVTDLVATDKESK